MAGQFVVMLLGPGHGPGLDPGFDPMPRAQRKLYVAAVLLRMADDARAGRRMVLAAGNNVGEFLVLIRQGPAFQLAVL